MVLHGFCAEESKKQGFETKKTTKQDQQPTPKEQRAYVNYGSDKGPGTKAEANRWLSRSKPWNGTRDFDGTNYNYTVVKIEEEHGTASLLYHVRYDDGDSEDLYWGGENGLYATFDLSTTNKIQKIFQEIYAQDSVNDSSDDDDELAELYSSDSSDDEEMPLVKASANVSVRSVSVRNVMKNLKLLIKQ